jgi:hypothetical protein
VSSPGAFLFAVVAGIGIFTYRNVEKWTPLQQWYWTEYLTTKSFPKARGDYQLLAKVDGQGKQLMAVDADLPRISKTSAFRISSFRSWIPKHSRNHQRRLQGEASSTSKEQEGNRECPFWPTP